MRGKCCCRSSKSHPGVNACALTPPCLFRAGWPPLPRPDGCGGGHRGDGGRPLPDTRVGGQQGFCCGTLRVSHPSGQTGGPGRDRAVPNHRCPQRESDHMCGGVRTQARGHTAAHTWARRGTQARSVSARQPQAPWSLWTPLALWSLHTRAHAQHHTCHSEVWLQLRGGPPSRPAGSVAPGQQPSPALPCPAVPTLRPSLCPSLSCRPTLRRTWIWPVDQVSA